MSQPDTFDPNDNPNDPNRSGVDPNEPAAQPTPGDNGDEQKRTEPRR